MLEDIDECTDIDDENESRSFKGKLKIMKNESSKISKIKWYVWISKRWISIYGHKTKTELISKILLDNITAMYINHLKNHILFKLNKLPNIWLKSESSVAILRIVYFI